MPHMTQNRSFQRRSSQLFLWLTTEKQKQTQQKQACICTKFTKHKINTKWSPLMTSSLKT